MVARLKNRRGQTSVEYLLLMAAAFVSGYIVISGPVANFTIETLNRIRSFMQTAVKDAELTNRQTEPGRAGHPLNRERHRPLHM